jgi:transcriptional regulator with XRE-family HTH domain
MGNRRARTVKDVAWSRRAAANARAARIARGLSQRALSERVKANGHRLDQSTLARLELGYNQKGGTVTFTVDHLMHLAEALGVEPMQLLADLCAVCAGSPPRGFACEKCGASTSTLASRPGEAA